MNIGKLFKLVRRLKKLHVEIDDTIRWCRSRLSEEEKRELDVRAALITAQIKELL